MTYQEALAEAKRVGATKAAGLPLLAMTLRTLADVHAINPELAYHGATQKGLTADKVRKLDPVSLGDLMFV